jgi:hypothetical protein
MRTNAAASSSSTRSPHAVHRAEHHRHQESDSYATDPMPDYENHSQEALEPRVGLRVVHETFGSGRIVALDGRGEDARAVVEFASVGRKKLLLKFARLKTG